MLGHKTIITLLAIGVIPAISEAATYELPSSGNDIIGQNYYVKAYSGDTLASVGLRNGMSYHEMLEANPKINPQNQLRPGQKVLIPAQFILPPFRKGIVINLPELRMYYFPANSNYVMTFPVAMGRDEWRTPTVSTSVVLKEQDPTWKVPKAIRDYHYEHTGELLPDEVPPGPENPLGHYALHLGMAGYLIHGNNAPTSIGKYVSSGCIRMKNSDIETLFNMVPVGTQVRIIHYPTKVGWENGVLYQETQKSVDIPDMPSELNQTSASAVINQATSSKSANVDWNAVEKVSAQTLGVPEPIGQSTTRQAHNDSKTLPMPASHGEASVQLDSPDIEQHAMNDSNYTSPSQAQENTDEGDADDTYITDDSSWSPSGGNQQ